MIFWSEHHKNVKVHDLDVASVKGVYVLGRGNNHLEEAIKPGKDPWILVFVKYSNEEKLILYNGSCYIDTFEGKNNIRVSNDFYKDLGFSINVKKQLDLLISKSI